MNPSAMRRVLNRAAFFVDGAGATRGSKSAGAFFSSQDNMEVWRLSADPNRCRTGLEAVSF